MTRPKTAGIYLLLVRDDTNQNGDSNQNSGSNQDIDINQVVKPI